jgi:hypothetical protein
MQAKPHCYQANTQGKAQVMAQSTAATAQEVTQASWLVMRASARGAMHASAR